MVQPAGYKKPLNILHFWQKASTEPPPEWSKRVAMIELAAFAKHGIEVRNLPRTKSPIIDPTKPRYEIEITGETEEQKRS